MTKQEIVDIVSNATGLTKVETETIPVIKIPIIKIIIIFFNNFD